MNIEQLKYIVEISQTGSLKAAAEKQNITLPALSQAVSKLENELNIELFHRSKRGSYPTEEGKLLIAKARKVLEKLQDFVEEAENYTNTLKGEIKIATFPGPMDVIVEIITQLKNEFPYIRASIEENNSQNIIEKVCNQEVDIGLIIFTEKDIKKNKQLIFNKMIDGRMVVAVNKHSSLANEKMISSSMLENQPIILYNDHCIIEFINELNSLAKQMEILFTTNNVETIRYALDNNTAINIGYNYSFETITGLANNDHYITINFAPDLSKTYYFGYICSAQKGLSRISKEFLKRLGTAISE